MFPKSLSDSELWSRTESLATEERRISVEFLHHLRELESRMLFAARGFGSLFEYLTAGLHYSEGAAHRRIQSMRALLDIPEIEVALRDGKLTLTTASQVQVFLKKESKSNRNYTREERRELFEKVEGLSGRETENLLVSISPESVKSVDRERKLAPNQTQITFVADAGLLQMLDRIGKA